MVAWGLSRKGGRSAQIIQASKELILQGMRGWLQKRFLRLCTVDMFAEGVLLSLLQLRMGTGLYCNFEFCVHVVVYSVVTSS